MDTASEMVHFSSFAGKQQLAESLARDVAEQLNDAISKRGKASLVVSGGSTPKPFFTALREQNVDWDKVYVTLADERWVDNSHTDSNEKLVRENLLVGGMNFVPLKNASADAAAGVDAANRAIESMPLPFDVTILGMGDDGHTASLFPTAAELEHALNVAEAGVYCAALNPPSYASHPRMTLTLPALLNSRRIILHITGAGKQDVYEKACRFGPVAEMPIRAVLRQEMTPVDVYWAA